MIWSSLSPCLKICFFYEDQTVQSILQDIIKNKFQTKSIYNWEYSILHIAMVIYKFYSNNHIFFKLCTNIASCSK
jgi:hypothetical protein